MNEGRRRARDGGSGSVELRSIQMMRDTCCWLRFMLWLVLRLLAIHEALRVGGCMRAAAAQLKGE